MKMLSVLMIVSLVLCVQPLHASARTDLHPIVFVENFDDSILVASRWSPRQNYQYAAGMSGQGITIERVAGASMFITMPISLDGLKGGAIALAASIKAENVSPPPNSWNGIKVMLKIVLANSSAVYPQVVVGSGSFDWAQKSLCVAIPDAAVSATLYLGLENCTGKVTFDDVVIRLLKDPKHAPQPRDPNIPIETYHTERTLRGTMVSTSIKQTDGLVLGAQWQANVMRWQLGGLSYPLGLLTPGYDSVLQKELSLLDSALVWSKLYGLKVVADLHGLSKVSFKDVVAQQRLVDTWKLISARYKNNTQVWAYDLANEPDPREGDWNDPALLVWEDLAEKIAREIRSTDPEKPIIIESVYGDPSNFSTLWPIDFSIPNIIYSAHFYLPHAFTHQTLYDFKTPYVYPGVIEGTNWDKAMLEEQLRPVKDFQMKYRVPIFIGEFSAIRWAPSNSAYVYLRDCIELFESYGWDWCYHAFREYEGWSVEMSENINDHTPTLVPNDRQQLLRSYFAKNSTSVRKKQVELTYRLMQNYPNPFNPSTTFSFTLPATSLVLLRVYDVYGREAAVVFSGEMSAGTHKAEWSAAQFASGVYFYRLQAGAYSETKSMMLLK
jgi:endoglucanase